METTSTPTTTYATPDPLAILGALYRDEEGHEVWRIHNLDGTVHQDGIASDYDASWIAQRVATGRN